MTKPITDDLIAYAQDQLRAIKGWHGRAYVERCLILWEAEYGAKVANKVRGAIDGIVR